MTTAGEQSARVARAQVTAAPVEVAELAAQVQDSAAGAVVTFDGVVRDHDQGRAVRAIDYSAHPSAGDVLGQIAQSVARRPGVRAIAVVHRTGHLAVGQTALGVAVSAEHRREAFEAAGEIVEQVKERLPVWKRQSFADGERQWSNLP